MTKFVFGSPRVCGQDPQDRPRSMFSLKAETLAYARKEKKATC